MYRLLFIIVTLVVLLADNALLVAQVQPVGAGSISLALPPGAKAPQAEISQTENIRGRMPTNDWWSSLAWMKFGERQYPHPLAVQPAETGLRVYYPGSSITANKDAIFGFMMPQSEDLILGHSEQAKFEDARVDGFNDWFVAARFGTPEKHLRVSYGHGSPYIFATLAQGSPQLTFADVPKIWSGKASSPVLGITIRGRHYGLFAPQGSKWEGLGTKTLTNRSDQDYFSLAILPDHRPETLQLFARDAYNHVVDTQVAWKFDPKSSQLTTTYTFTTKAYEGDGQSTLFALYPHQWRHTQHKLLPYAYPSVRGQMKLAEGTSFTTSLPFTGVLPCLPKMGNADGERLTKYLQSDLESQDPPFKDTYWDGKWLGKTTMLAAIAETYGQDDLARQARERVRQRLEAWFTATNAAGEPKKTGLFVYNKDWGTLIGYPASYGSDVELNDHHFHYGYFIKAAADIAQHDPAWAKDERYGAMVKLLIRDVVGTNRDDKEYPYLRNFDPYAGHSWASGHAKFGDGNNNESSSEAMNAWAGIILWGEATGDTATRDLGIYLYTTEMAAINEYWFDTRNENHPVDYPPSVVTMVWGGKGANGTWFTANPEMVHGINFLPITGASLYLGHDPEYVNKNYQALALENKGTDWDAWGDIICMYRALYDPVDALKQFDSQVAAKKSEEGNSRANAYHWITALEKLGHVDASITANATQYAVFRSPRQRTYVVFNPTTGAREVTFSDGEKLSAQQGFTVVPKPLK